jgi:hypothetical protein
MGWWDGCEAVRCGFWVNWSDGAVYGSTLTLPIQFGLVLTAFVALFVKVAGGYLWGIICFALHQSSASTGPADDIHHQLQTIKRNTEHETSFIWNIYKVAVAHRGARLEVYKRSVWLVLLAVVHGVGFSVAGGLSSRLMVAKGQVQIVPGQCGWIKDAPINAIAETDGFNAVNALIVTTRNGFRRSATYARSCYARSEGNTTICGTFVQPALSYDTNFDAPCPFDEKICNASAALMDTGLVRSDEHLGINTRVEDAMSLRKQLTCVPLAGEKYTDGWKVANKTEWPHGGTAVIILGSEAIGYKFGQTHDTKGNLTDYTFRLPRIFIEDGDLPYNVV